VSATNYIEQLESSPWELKDSADFRMVKAYCLHKFNMVKECIEVLEEVNLEDVRYPPLRIDFHIVKGSLAFHDANWEEARAEFERAYKISDREGILKHKLLAMENLARVYWKTGRCETCIEIVKKALLEAEKVDDKSVKGRLLITQSLIVEDAFEGAKAALPLIEEAIKCFKDAGNTYDLARAFNKLGVAYFKLGNYRKALFSWKKAFIYGVQAYNRLHKLYSQVNLADIYSRMGEYKEAMKHLKEAEKEIKETGNKVLLPYVYLNQAIVYDNMRRYRSANESFSKAIEAVKNMGTPLNMAEIYMIYAKFLWKLKKKRSARLYKRNSLQLYRKYGGEEI